MIPLALSGRNDRFLLLPVQVGASDGRPNAPYAYGANNAPCEGQFNRLTLHEAFFPHFANRRKDWRCGGARDESGFDARTCRGSRSAFPINETPEFRGHKARIRTIWRATGYELPGQARPETIQ
jgi:hypothetical protein